MQKELDITEFPFDLISGEDVFFWKNIGFKCFRGTYSDEGKCMPLTGIYFIDFKNASVYKIGFLQKENNTLSNPNRILASNFHADSLNYVLSTSITIKHIIEEKDNFLFTTDYHYIVKKAESIKLLT
jgi:hypothetical protein